jgi:hypothetical protein
VKTLGFVEEIDEVDGARRDRCFVLPAAGCSMLIGDERKLGRDDLEGVPGDSGPTRRLQLLNRPSEAKVRLRAPSP